MCEHGKQVVLDMPDWVDEGKLNRTIACDECCVNVIKYLWANKINTLSHCCGHGKTEPSIVIADGYTWTEIKRIEGIITEIDSREWSIYQWRLAKVN